MFTTIKEYFMSWGQKSADGRGRSLLDIILWRNAKPMGPVEFQYHNPFGIKIGNSITVDHDMNLSGINFFVDAILVYETVMDNGKRFYDTEYNLRGQALGMLKPKFVRLRVTADDNALDPKFPYALQILERYHEQAWDQDLYDYLNKLNGTGEFQVNHADDGTELAEPRLYWRVNDVPDPYQCNVTIMRDLNRDGVIDEETELERKTVTFWDFHRETTDDGTKEKFAEYLNAEMDNDTRYFHMYRGRAVMPFQVKVI